jgi:YidC/Oxa1 family membrane protein insertase
MNPLDLLEAPLRAVLDFFHSVGFTWGWAIVMLTLVVRLILLPLFVKQYKSARRMQEVAPQMKEMQRKYKGNKQKLQEEMMKFYKENDVNPFGSCLPLLLQAPVFIALYYTLRSQNFADGTDLSFMYVVPDVSKLLTEIGWAVVPLIVVYAVSQLISTELSATATMSRNQRWLMRLLPIGIVFFIFQFPVPAGLVIYWATTNLWTAGQQLVLKRRIEAEIEAKGGTLLGAAPAKASAPDEGGAEEEAHGDGEAPAPSAGEAVATEDVEVRTKPLPRRRKGRKNQAAEPGAAAPAQGAAESGAAKQQDGAPAGEAGDGGADAHEDPPPAPPAGSASGKKKRKPPTRKKVSGGPSRPARRKPPKRRK